MSFAPAGFLASSPLTRALKAFQGYFFSHCLHRACHIVSYLGRLLFVRLSCSLLASDHTCQVPIQSDHKGDLHRLGGCFRLHCRPLGCSLVSRIFWGK